MINPANYYNPFAKYNYVSKTRGVYMPKPAEHLLVQNTDSVGKSSNIYSPNYDAETDLNVVLANSEFQNPLDFVKKFFSRKINCK